MFVFFVKILTLAATIAKNTSVLCNISRDASSNTTNSIAPRRFVQSAKDVANATAELVRAIKVFDSSYTQDNHRHCIEISRPLIQAIDELYTYAMSKEFASKPATISSAVRFYIDKKIFFNFSLFRVDSYKNRYYLQLEMLSTEHVGLLNVQKH